MLSVTQTPNIDTMPYEIIIGILSNLSMHDILNASMVSRRLHEISKDAYLWKNVEFNLVHRFTVPISNESNESKHTQKLKLRSKYQNDSGIVWFMGNETKSFEVMISKNAPCEQMLRLNAEKFKYIRSLNLAACNELISNDGLIQLLKYMPNLANVDLSNCFNIVNDQAIDMLLCNTERAESLECLRLKRCYSVGPKSLKQIGKKCKNLKVLDISGLTVSFDILNLLFPLDDLVDLSSQHTRISITSFDQSEPGCLAYTLEELYMNNLDYSIEFALKIFLRNLIKVPTKLRHLGIKNSAIVNFRVLEQLFSLYRPSNATANRGSSRLVIDVNGCDNLTVNEIDSCLKEIKKAVAGTKEVVFKYPGNMIKSDNETDVREYIRQLVYSTA